jgi:hypothetical protein
MLQPASKGVTPLNMLVQPREDLLSLMHVYQADLYSLHELCRFCFHIIRQETKVLLINDAIWVPKDRHLQNYLHYR